MARPRKKGLDYFPLDIDIFASDKLFDVQNEYGPLGEVIYLRLLCLVYKHGYYYRFDSIDKLAAMVMRSVGNRWTRDKKTVIGIISYLAESGLFSSELMQRNILTSRGIQERYLLATERRQSHIEEFSLLENACQEGGAAIPGSGVSVTKTEVSASEAPVNAGDNAPKESKENKTKEKHSKENETAFPSEPARTGRYGKAYLSDTDYRELSAEYSEDIVDKYLARADEWAFRKDISLGSCEAMLRKWLEKDGVRKTDPSIREYESVIGQFLY